MDEYDPDLDVRGHGGAGSPSRSGPRHPHPDDDDDEKENSPFDEFLSTLRGRPPADHPAGHPDRSFNDESSYASSGVGAPSPPRKFSRDDDGHSSAAMATTSPPVPSPIRKSSPFARLRSKVPSRWRKRWGTPSQPLDHDGDDDHDEDNDEDTAAMTALESTTHSLARDIMEDDATDDDDDDDDDDGHDDHAHQHHHPRHGPPSNFLSRKARLTAVSRRHAFPPSKCPTGKLDDIGFQQQSNNHHNNYNNTAWIQSYDWTSEGILPSGWLEKHARALPSAVVVVTSLKERLLDEYFRGAATTENDGPVERHVVQAVEDLRMTLADKRMVPIHLVCLLPHDHSDKDERESHSRRGMGSGGKRDVWMEERLAALREKICQECYLPQSQVTILKYPQDLEKDEWEEKVRRSPYLPGAPRMAGVGADGTSTSTSTANTTTTNVAILGPRLRELDRAIRDSSAMYYSRLADHQEKKLVLWRNRYHSTNQSFVVNTTVAAMRCARYAMKAATLRELQARTEGRSSWASLAGNGNGAMTIDGGGSGLGARRWTDKGSAAMRHYEEAYRWVIELHRRAISWRAAPVGTDDTFAGLTPMTPGNAGDESPEAMTSPKFIDSPGGNIGVELAYPISPGANDSFHYPTTPGANNDNGNAPPPSQLGDRSMQRRNSNQYTQNGPFFSQLWEQCRAVASIINAKLLRSASTSSAIEAEDQWRRHRLVFLASPQNIANFHPAENDDFFGPTWHRIAYAAAELSTFACIAEGRWRRAAMHSSRRNLTPALSIMASYHQPLAPWRIYGELAEATLRLGREVHVENRMQNRMEPGFFGEESNVVFGRRKFVGSIVSGDGVGTMQWYFNSESLRDHRAMALEYVLHALDILKENDSMCPKGTVATSPDTISTEREYKPVDSSARLHYLAGRLLLGQGSPKEALSYLKLADALTKKWPSLNVAVQRTLVACVDHCRRDGIMSERPSSKDASIEMLLRPDMCKLLSTFEKSLAQRDVWEVGYAPRTLTASKEVIWTDDERGEAKPPFEFTVSFSQSTHAIASSEVLACVSIESGLDFPVFVSSIQLMTTSGLYDVTNLGQCLDKSTLQSNDGRENLKSRTMYSPRQGVLFHPKDVVFFLTELTLPSDLSSIALGGSSVDLSKFMPKNGKLCNMGYSYAAGSICNSRFENERQPITLTGKPVTLSSLDEKTQLFLGGVPLVCYGMKLSLKHASIDGDTNINSSLRLVIDRQHVLSPLGRSGAQRLIMEESNYLSYSWSRSKHHPWSLGPQCLRVHGPRPLLEVTNLSEKVTSGRGIRGTVNRMVFKLKAGADEDCRDVRVWLRCRSTKLVAANESMGEIQQTEEGPNNIEQNLTPLFVQKASDPSSTCTTEDGVKLPQGWEPRRDVARNDSNETSSPIVPHLESGKSTLLALDLFCPLSETPIPAGSPTEVNTFSTSFEVIIEYKQTRGRKVVNDESGDHVMVMHNGTLTWIPPFAADFFLTNGNQKPFPGGYQHQSNVLTKSALKNSAIDEFEMVAADGEQVRMRCVVETQGLGTESAGKILSVKEEREPQPVVLYSSSENSFMDKMKQGSKLSLSYSFSADRSIQHSNRSIKTPLGTVSVHWKPNSFVLGDDSVSEANFEKSDDFGLAYGPLSLTDIEPMKFHGPLCYILNAPFCAQLRDCPSAPKVGLPFQLTYQITNRTAKFQTLTVSMHSNSVRTDDSTYPSNNELLVTGKTKSEMQMAPFETQSIGFTFMSTVAGKVLRPPLTVSSARHQSWVINEIECMNSRYLFVMP